MEKKHSGVIFRGEEENEVPSVVDETVLPNGSKIKIWHLQDQIYKFKKPIEYRLDKYSKTKKYRDIITGLGSKDEFLFWFLNNKFAAFLRTPLHIFILVSHLLFLELLPVKEIQMIMVKEIFIILHQQDIQVGQQED